MSNISAKKIHNSSKIEEMRAIFVGIFLSSHPLYMYYVETSLHLFLEKSGKRNLFINKDIKSSLEFTFIC